MSSDVLYLSPNTGAVATLTIRVANQYAQPLQGKRVQVMSAVSGAHDTIIQPDQPTDVHGITTARVRPAAPLHEAQFSARILDDNVHVGQNVEIVVQTPDSQSFFPDAFAPYFDDLHFVVDPLPLRVGQRTTTSLPLTNRRQVPVQLKARFFATVPNIGLGDWPQIGETESINLKPGETREARITWVPTVESPHLCMKVELWGRELTPRVNRVGLRRRLGLIQSAFAQEPVPGPSPTPTPMGSRQQNIGPVSQLACDGTWERQHVHVQLGLVGKFTCTCYWLCKPPDGQVLWSGNPYDLPFTRGVPAAANPKNAAGCICNPPGPSTGGYKM